MSDDILFRLIVADRLLRTFADLDQGISASNARLIAELLGDAADTITALRSTVSKVAS